MSERGGVGNRRFYPLIGVWSSHPLLCCHEPDELCADDPACIQAKDSFKYHPWRAPGFAPVVDVCGMAGGGPHPGTGAGVFTATPWAKQGDLGSKVSPFPPLRDSSFGGVAAHRRLWFQRLQTE